MRKKVSLGRGMRFPSIFNISTGRTAVIEEEEKVRQSLRTILSTRKGSLGFVPDFGSDLYKIIFEPSDVVFEDLAEVYIREAIETWEPRVVIREVIVERPQEKNEGNLDSADENYVDITVKYTLKRMPNVDGFFRHRLYTR